jgi:hypothetical protein
MAHLGELKKHTEAAMELLQGQLKELVYLPPETRKRNIRVDANGRATTHPPTEKEQLQRITLADPLGFLLAVMNGQPVVTFGVRNIIVDTPRKRSKNAPARLAKSFSVLTLDETDGQEVYAKVHVPSMDERMDSAKFLVPYITTKATRAKAPETPESGEDDPTSFDAKLDQRLAQLKEQEHE